jgi:hypothetical protein
VGISSPYAYLPVIDDQQAEAAESLLAHFERGLEGSSEAEIERMIGKIALIYPSAKLTPAEAEMRLELYIELLRDLPFDCLSAGFREVAKASRFFPTVAEIRAAAEPLHRARQAKFWALRSLLMKHRAEWAPLIATERV